MRARLLGIAALVLWILLHGEAIAKVDGKKVALVIGNGSYAHAMALPNPVGDGKLIAETLRNSGFTVIEGSDLDKADMTRLLDQFTEAAYDADIALLYYAGHGLQVDGHNYLIPVDAELEKPAQLQTRTIPVDEVLAALPPDPAVGIVILDACRDNPLARTLAAAMPKSRSMGAGLAPVQANGLSHDAGGLLIAYATDPGAVAYDGSGEHSPYTTALARNLATPGLEIQSALTRVRAEVSTATNGAQRPWHNASLGREVFIGGQQAAAESSPPPDAAEPAHQAGAAPNAGGEVDWTVERTVWEEASKRNTVAYYQFYLAQYPHGRFANLADLSIEELKNGGGGAARSTETASIAPDASPAAASDDVKQVPGTPVTEAALKLTLDARIDLQLRLSALNFYGGSFDGSLGDSSRAAIGAWQHENGIAETTFLTAGQRMLLVTQSDSVVGPLREQYERHKAAAIEAPKKAQKAAPAPRAAPAPKPRKPVITVSKPVKKRQVASARPSPAAQPQPQPPAKSKYCTVYDVVSQSLEPCR